MAATHPPINAIHQDARRLFVVGATGYLGVPLMQRAGAFFSVHGTSRMGSPALLDLRLETPEEFNYDLIRPRDVVLLAAAVSSPDVCAREPERARAINVVGTSGFISRVLDRKGCVIFFSSDTVYGETEDECDETSTCKPAGEYSAMKHEIEMRFAAHPLFKVIRLSYVFSRGDKFTQYLTHCSGQGLVASIFHPLLRAVVYQADVVEGAITLAKRWDEFPQNVINFGGPELVSRTEFASTLRAVALPNLQFEVSKPADDFFVNRPRTIQMASPHLSKILGRPAHTLRHAAMIEFKSRDS